MTYLNSQNSHIFISRHIDQNQSHWQRIIDLGWTIEGQSLIDFTPANFKWADDCDWIFFSSKNGVQFFFEGISPLELIKVQKIKLAAIGVSTAAKLKKWVPYIDKVFDGNPMTCAHFFNQLKPGSSILFPQARISNRTVQLNIVDEINIIDIIVYNNTTKGKIQINKVKLAILTSPLNAKFFFKYYNHEEPIYLFVPGRITAEQIIKNQNNTPFIFDSYEEKTWATALYRFIVKEYVSIEDQA